MKNNKGFTIVELLAVISIIGMVFIIAAPVVMNFIGDSRSTLKGYEEKTLLDAAKYYLTDIDLGDKEFTYNGNSPVDVNGTTYTKGMVMNKYDAKTYIIESNGFIITVGDLVKMGYFDKDCKYAGETVEYKEDGVTKTSVLAKNSSCSAPKECKIKLSIDGKKVENDLYYITNGYEASILDGC